MSAPMFWMALGALALLAALLVAWPARRGAPAPDGEAGRDARRAENVAAYRQQRRELEAARDAGTLTAEAFAAALLELDRRLLADTAELEAAANDARGGRALLLGAALAVPLLALLLYRQLGAHTEIELAALIEELSGEMPPTVRSERLERLLPLLEAQVARRDPEGSYRFLLARVHAGEGRHAAAAPLFAELAGLYPEDAEIAAQAAQARFLAEGRRLTPEVRTLAERALAIEPRHAGVRGMLGMASFQAGDYARAIEHWEILLAQLPADVPDATLVRDGIAAARARLAAPAPDAAQPAPAPSTAPDPR